MHHHIRSQVQRLTHRHINSKIHLITHLLISNKMHPLRQQVHSQILLTEIPKAVHIVLAVQVYRAG